jgi:hypothetical protein
VCPQERLVIISYTTGLSFALERIGPLAAFTIIVFYLLARYLLALPNTPENPFASIYSESLIKTTCQHLMLLVGFDTLICRKYYDTPPILVGHQTTRAWLLSPFCCKKRIARVWEGAHERGKKNGPRTGDACSRSWRQRRKYGGSVADSGEQSRKPGGASGAVVLGEKTRGHGGREVRGLGGAFSVWGVREGGGVGGRARKKWRGGWGRVWPVGPACRRGGKKEKKKKKGERGGCGRAASAGLVGPAQLATGSLFLLNFFSFSIFY